MADELPSASADDLERPATDRKQKAKKWCAEIAASERKQAKWMERARKIEKIYADERDGRSDRGRKFNILWSNVETLRPAVYMQTPKAQAVRRYRDRDPVARLASMMLERCVQTSCELYDFDNQIDQSVRDRLVPGRGQVWVFYEPGFVGRGDEQALAYENVMGEYVPWQDFLHSVCRTWAENRWVARRFHKTRTELKEWLKQNGLDPSVAAKVRMDVSTEGDKTDEGLKDERDKAQIWEIWDKDSAKVLYVAPGSVTDAFLGEKDPPVRFRDFWPCPRPLLATTTAQSLIPTPDYALYQDQAKQLDDMEARIGVLLKALKVVGVYASDSAELASLIEGGDNRMIAVKNWAMFAEGGGVKGRIEWFPVEQVATVLKGLLESREVVKQTLYEVSGIGDILRGSTDPDETATAQGIKAKWGSLRVRRIQKDVQRFAANIIQLKAEVIAEQFSDRSIMKMAGVDQELLQKYVPPPPPKQPQPPQGGPPGMPGQPMDPQAAQIAQMQALAQQQAAKQEHLQAVQQFMQQVFALLRDDTARNFRIDVESDSTLEPDQQEEKQAAVEYLTAMSAFMEKGQPLVMSGPEGAKLFGEMLLFATRRFDKVDSLEQTIEQAVEAWSKPKPPPPNPEMMKVQAQIAGDKAKLQMEGQRNQQEMAHEKEMHQLEMSAKVQEVQIDGAVQQQKVQQEAVAGQQKLALAAAQGAQQLRQGEQQGELARRQGEQKMSIAERQAKMKRDVAEGGPPE